MLVGTLMVIAKPYKNKWDADGIVRLDRPKSGLVI